MQQESSSRLHLVARGWVLLALGIAGCGGGDGTAVQQNTPSATPTGSSFDQATAVQQAQKANAPVDPSIVAADDALGLDLLSLLNQGGATNVSISPVSIALSLQMLYNGAAGTTQQAMDQALQLNGLSALTVDQDNAALQASLINPDPEAQLTVANSLWMSSSNTPVLPSFTQTNQTYYAAQIGDLANAPADVNAWVAQATGNLITQILPADFKPSSVVLLIANAVYFKASWSTAFDPAQTTTVPFIRADGSQVSSQMMHQTASFQYLQTDSVQVVRLPYGQNGRMSMLIALPQGGLTLDSLAGSLTTAELNSWLAQLSSARVAVGLPRFTTSYNTSLVSALTSLGMGIAFSRDADLSALAPLTRVTFVQHATAVQVDEAGTVATGTTVVGVGPVFVIQPKQMTMDRPFLYAIRDDETGALLFVGLMFDPTAG
jgi:serpin B